MLNFMALIPETLLSATLVLMLLTFWLRDKNTPKTFYTIAKWGVLAALIAEVVLYNQSLLRENYINNSQIMLFKVIVYLLLLGNMHISLKWFLSEDKSSFRFYFTVLLLQLCWVAALSAVNLLVFVAVLMVGLAVAYWLLGTHIQDDEEELNEIRRFRWVALLYGGIGIIGAWWLGALSGGFQFADIRALVTENPQNVEAFAAAAMVMVSLLFMLGVAPFHFWMAGVLSAAILPVSGYLSVVPLFAIYACLINLMTEALEPMFALFIPVLKVFAVISILIGAIGANNENNLRKLFVFSRLFVIGIVLAVLVGLSETAEFSGFVFLLVSMLAMAGIYTVFYGFKSKGEYLSNMQDVAGIAESKPYIAAAMLMFMTSLLGFPPLLGFVGMLIVLDDLVSVHQYGIILAVMLGILMMASAYLRVIKVMYFDEKQRSFDRVDRGIYMILLTDVVIIVALLVSPKELLGAIAAMLRL